MPDSGINISLREIFDTLQEVATDVKELKPQLTSLEKRVEQGEAALPIAEEANRLARKHENSFKWLWRTVLTALVVSAIGMLFALASTLVQSYITNQAPLQAPTKVEIKGGQQ